MLKSCSINLILNLSSLIERKYTKVVTKLRLGRVPARLSTGSLALLPDLPGVVSPPIEFPGHSDLFAGWEIQSQPIVSHWHQ